MSGGIFGMSVRQQISSSQAKLVSKKCNTGKWLGGYCCCCCPRHCLVERYACGQNHSTFTPNGANKKQEQHNVLYPKNNQEWTLPAFLAMCVSANPGWALPPTDKPFLSSFILSYFD